MPIYGYQCTKCDHRLEVLQSMSAAPLISCPQCEGQLRKLLYPVGVHFKGSGFYSTDYKSSGAKEVSSPSEDKGKSDSKPETKSEPAGAAPSGGSKEVTKGDSA